MKYNVTQVIQSQKIDQNEPVEISWGKGLTEIGAASSVTGILDTEDKFSTEGREEWDPNLLGIKVTPVPEGGFEAFDLLAHFAKMDFQIRMASGSLADENEAGLRQAAFRLTLLADQLHNLVQNW